MICPECNRDDSHVIDTRLKNYGRKRRYECGSCSNRFSTVEVHAEHKKHGEPLKFVMLSDIEVLIDDFAKKVKSRINKP